MDYPGTSKRPGGSYRGIEGSRKRWVVRAGLREVSSGHSFLLHTKDFGENQAGRGTEMKERRDGSARVGRAWRGTSAKVSRVSPRRQSAAGLGGAEPDSGDRKGQIEVSFRAKHSVLRVWVVYTFPASSLSLSLSLT